MTPSSPLLSARQMGGLNRALVLRSLADRGPLSRSDLARLAGVSRGTIGTIVGGLIDDGLLIEGEPAASGSIGKPSRPLWFAPGAGTVVAVELRATEVRAAAIDASGTFGPVAAVRIPDARRSDGVLGATVDAIARVAPDHAPIGLGLAVPGSCDTEQGVILGSNQVPGAVGTALVEHLRDVTGWPVQIENDSRAQALAERWFGQGRGLSTFISLQTGEGLGAGLLIDGRIHRGPRGNAGEVGHTMVVPDGEPCRCGLRGCWETIASLRWLRAQARAAGLPAAGSIDCRRLTTYAAKERPGAAELLDRYAVNLAIGIANLNQVLAPELVVLHGDAVGGGESFRRAVEDAARPRAFGPLAVALTALDDRATLAGAAAVVLVDELHRG